MLEKDLTFEEKKQLLEAMNPDTPWVKSEVVELQLKVKVIVKHCAQEVYGRNLSKMFELHILKQLRDDGILPPVGTPLVRMPEPGEELGESSIHMVKETKEDLTPDPKSEAKRKITRLGLARPLKKK